MGWPRIPIKTVSYDGRKHTAMPVTKNGEVSYTKPHLRTKDDECPGEPTDEWRIRQYTHDHKELAGGPAKKATRRR